MKKILVGILFAYAALAHGQSAIIRGEVSPGIYQNYQASDSSVDTRVTGNVGLYTQGMNYVFNGTSWDRWRSSPAFLGVARVAVLGVDPCQSSDVTKLSAPIAITTATTTQLVALSGSLTIYVCNFELTISQVVTTANTLRFVYGTGANCGTGTVNLTGDFGAGGVTAAPPLVITASSGATRFKTIGGQALCVTTAIGATAFFQGVVTYVQQ